MKILILVLLLKADKNWKLIKTSSSKSPFVPSIYKDEYIFRLNTRHHHWLFQSN